MREGGCILADEVGLGKTIETGLVIAQMFAESARRVLLIAPKALLGQWRQELFQLFGIEAHEGRPMDGGFDGEGVFLIGREAAGSERGRDALIASERFDLCVIDEAHEVFAGIYKRFNKFGEYDDDAEVAQTAGRVRHVLRAAATPVLLLTATPIQNNLAELWGLVQFVDPMGTLMGSLPTFREVFCGADDRELARGQEAELRSRLRVVVQRTLRRQAQEFLERPFVNRQAKLFEYAMSPAERSLYDDVTRYLLEPGIVAFSGSQRKLLLLGFHRRMASSTRALAASLQRVAGRLARKLAGVDELAQDAEDANEVVADLEDDDEAPVPPAPSAGPTHAPEAIRAEHIRVEGFIRRAEALGAEDGKFRALLQAFTFVTERARNGQGSGKLVIFTESLVTQEYLRDRLVESRFVSEEDITLFRGTNESPRVHDAVRRWLKEVPQDDARMPSPDIAARLALVHEFRTRSRVFVSTEAGAKGLNLQFCDTLVNYDLPWNPQRIEQRIGRCHRYGQVNDVTVINFLAKDNEAQALTYEILSQKLELFGAVLDASDQVLHRADGPGGEVLSSALGAEFEAALRRIYDRARTLDEVTAELRALRDRVAEERARFEETHTRTASLIEERFDEAVQRVFRLHKQQVPGALAALDRDLVVVVTGYLDSQSIPYRWATEAGKEVLHVLSSTKLPPAIRGGTSAAVGESKEHSSLHLRHPLVLAAVEHARTVEPAGFVVSVSGQGSDGLRRYVGRRGRFRLVKVGFSGFEAVELLIPVVLLDDGSLLDAVASEEVIRNRIQDRAPVGALSVTDAAIDDAVQEVLFSLQSSIDSAEQARFERAQLQADRFVEDRLLVLRRRRRMYVDRLEDALHRRDAAVGSEARTAAELLVVNAQTSIDKHDGDIGKLERREDSTFIAFQKDIYKRRYAPPRVESLFDMDLVIE